MNFDSCFLQIWGNRPFYYGWRLDREGYWGEVMNANGVMMRVYLGTTSDVRANHRPYTHRAFSLLLRCLMLFADLG